MKQYNSMYLGLCINNNDPEKRGRVQIFIPHIMPALYEGWNKEGNDIEINCVGDNMPEGLTSDLIERLSKILPWAESASPIVGTSAPGNLLTSVIAGAKSIIGKIFDQSPAAEPASIGDLSGLFNEASKFVGSDGRGSTVKSSWNTTRGPGNCLRGSQGILGALTGHPRFDVSKSGGLGENATLFSGAGGQDFTSTGLYNKPASIGDDYLKDSSKWQVGDVIACSGGGPKNNGHIQVWTGKDWVSDFTQGKILDGNTKGSYDNFVLHRANEAGQARINQRAGSLIKGQSPATAKEATSLSGEVAAANVHQNPTPINQDDTSSQYGNVANPEVTLQTQPSEMGLSKGSGLYSDNFVNFVKSKESFYGSAYWDYKQYTVGYGTKAKYPGETISRDEAEVRLKVELDKAANETNSLLAKRGITNLTQSQKEALMSFTYNGGSGMTASLLDGNGGRKDWASISEGMKQYNKAGGKVLKGLTNRRNDEIEFANTNGAGGFVSSGSTNLVNNTDPHGTTATLNLNNMAKGLFTYPAAGSMLWVFFREGNPLYPVYFAASYSQSEWASAYRLGSDGQGYRPASTPDNPVTSTGGIMNLNGVGGIRWEDTNNPTNRLQDQKSIMFFGEDGSNIFMGKGYNQYFSKFDRRDQVEGDRWNSTLGFKEEWVQGDDNKVVMGDVYVKIGNVSQPAVDAVTQIQKLIKEIQEPLSKTTS